jgi:GMP synthase (glutamine-hydrolysing)
MRLLVLQHDQCGGLGRYERVLAEHAVDAHVPGIDDRARLPDWRAFDGILALGGEQSLAARSVPIRLAHERASVAEAVRSGVPFFGVCLGAQLLAASLGAAVYRGPAPEVGLQSVFLTAAGRGDPLFRGLPARLSVFQWHGDGFELPRGAVLLAGSSAYSNQAFRWGACAYGFQFHLEVTPHMARAWAELRGYERQLAAADAHGGLPKLLAALEAHAAALDALAATLLTRWLVLARRTKRVGGMKSASRGAQPGP